MTKLVLSTHRAQRWETGDGVSIIFDGKPGPFPKQIVEIRNTAEALKALEAYRDEAAKINVPLVAVMEIGRGERAPNGFKKANHQFWHRVNV